MLRLFGSTASKSTAEGAQAADGAAEGSSGAGAGARNSLARGSLARGSNAAELLARSSVSQQQPSVGGSSGAAMVISSADRARLRHSTAMLMRADGAQPHARPPRAYHDIKEHLYDARTSSYEGSYKLVRVQACTSRTTY